MNLFTFIKERLFKPNYEPEPSETVEHDIVMVMVDGNLTEVTDDDY